jgi:hypothetical protein
MSNNKPLIAALLELGAGYFGLMGLGWIFAGDILRGILFLIGYMVFLAVGGALVVFSGGCLALIFAPLYVAIPIVSAVKVYEFASEWY